MAALFASCCSFHFHSSAPSTSSCRCSGINNRVQLPLKKPKLPSPSPCSKPRLFHNSITNLIVVPPLFLFSGSSPPNTQTVLVTVSVLSAIALSLFLGLKVLASLHHTPSEIQYRVANVLEMFISFYSVVSHFHSISLIRGDEMCVLRKWEDEERNWLDGLQGLQGCRIDSVQEMQRFWIF
ncbi:hypothetical protein LINPERPRIM_LOCUS6427 [Linum perenne]